MNSTWIKIAIAYTAGMITYSVFQNYEEAGQIKMLMDFETDSATVAPIPCACDNDPRYDVSPKEESGNIPIDNVAACQAMVNGAVTTPQGTKGAWFSKVTLDLMFCHAPDANGIFVYNGTMPGSTNEPVYLVEAARTNKIITDDDGSSTVYYSRTLCPNICGRCGE